MQGPSVAALDRQTRRRRKRRRRGGSGSRNGSCAQKVRGPPPPLRPGSSRRAWIVNHTVPDPATESSSAYDEMSRRQEHRQILRQEADDDESNDDETDKDNNGGDGGSLVDMTGPSYVSSVSASAFTSGVLPPLAAPVGQPVFEPEAQTLAQLYAGVGIKTTKVPERARLPRLYYDSGVLPSVASTPDVFRRQHHGGPEIFHGERVAIATSVSVQTGVLEKWLDRWLLENSLEDDEVVEDNGYSGGSDAESRRCRMHKGAAAKVSRDAVKVLMHIAKRTGWASSRENVFKTAVTAAASFSPSVALSPALDGGSSLSLASLSKTSRMLGGDGSGIMASAIVPLKRQERGREEAPEWPGTYTSQQDQMSQAQHQMPQKYYLTPMFAHPDDHILFSRKHWKSDVDHGRDNSGRGSSSRGVASARVAGGKSLVGKRGGGSKYNRVKGKSAGHVEASSCNQVVSDVRPTVQSQVLLPPSEFGIPPNSPARIPTARVSTARTARSSLSSRMGSRVGSSQTTSSSRKSLHSRLGTASTMLTISSSGIDELAEYGDEEQEDPAQASLRCGLVLSTGMYLIRSVLYLSGATALEINAMSMHMDSGDTQSFVFPPGVTLSSALSTARALNKGSHQTDSTNRVLLEMLERAQRVFRKSDRAFKRGKGKNAKFLKKKKRRVSNVGPLIFAAIASFTKVRARTIKAESVLMSTSPTERERQHTIASTPNSRGSSPVQQQGEGMFTGQVPEGGRPRTSAYATTQQRTGNRPQTTPNDWSVRKTGGGGGGAIGQTRSHLSCLFVVCVCGPGNSTGALVVPSLAHHLRQRRCLRHLPVQR
jgi:hypothetical protein